MQILYTSSFFGDEMWPCENVGFTKTTISNNGRDYMDFIVNKGAPILPPRNKLPAPPRFGKSLSKRQLETATHICLDCGFIYFKKQPFAELDGGYQCPQCAAPKVRGALAARPAARPRPRATPVRCKPSVFACLHPRGAQLTLPNLPRRSHHACQSRFAEFDKETGLPKGGFNTPLVSAISGLLAAGAIAYFTYLGLS